MEMSWFGNWTDDLGLADAVRAQASGKREGEVILVGDVLEMERLRLRAMVG